MTPLHHAGRHGNRYGQLEVVKLLFERGADLFSKDQVGISASTLLISCFSSFHSQVDPHLMLLLDWAKGVIVIIW
jgi:ankyrin repeat protein